MNKYPDINIGTVYSFEKRISEKDVMDFANLTGDLNPLHVNKKFGRKSRFKSNVVHGMLSASLFSTLIGMHCLWSKCVYLSQTLKFKNPIFPGDNLLVRGTIIGKSDSVKIVTIKTEIIVKDKIAVSGEAKVGIMEGD